MNPGSSPRQTHLGDGPYCCRPPFLAPWYGRRTLKTCKSCKKSRLLSEFHVRRASADGLALLCKPCARASSNAWYHANKEKARATNRKWRAKNLKRNLAKQRDYGLWHRYRLTPEAYDKLLADQDGKCALCQRVAPSKKRLNVDHDHKCCPGRETCGKCIRGLLCNRCNNALGVVEDRLDRVATYVDRRMCVS